MGNSFCNRCEFFGEYVRKWKLGCLCEPENIESIRSAFVELVCQWIRTGGK